MTGYTYHKINPLKGSLNAVDVANKVVDIPQIHYVGDLDRNIGLRLAGSFKARSGPGACLQIKIVSGASHGKGWAKLWTKLNKIKLPDCGSN